MVHRRKTHSVVVACGDETQQELIPFKHKESWIAGIVGVDGDRDRRHDARELTVQLKTHEAPVKLLRIR